jgi:superfamily II DNA or RNA helicase
MPIQLRDYQTDLVSRTGQALRRGPSVLLQAPPGAGKTAMATYMAEAFSGRGDAVWFMCHRAELLEQSSKTFSRYGLAHGYIAAGLPMNLHAPVQVCSIDTLKNRLDQLRPPKFALIDECHHSGAAGWAKVIQWLLAGGCKVVGLSGTPHRHDGTGLGDHYGELVLGPAVSWLIEHGHLAPYRIFAPDKPDRKAMRKMAGDFNKKDATDQMAKPKLMGSIVGHWKERARGLLTVGFGVTVAHSQFMAEQFRAAGVNAVHLDGGTDKAERRAMIRDFGPGGIEVIFNVALFGEGFDLAAIAQRDVSIDAVIDAAPGMSLSWHRQKVMRAMRPGAPGKVAIILDHAGNSDALGFPDDETEWSLDGQPKKKAANDNGPPPPVTCDKCFTQIRRPLPPECPCCGKRLQAEAQAVEVDESVGLSERTEEDKRAVRERRAREEAECRDLGAFAALGKARGYANPVGWAHKRMAARMTKRRAA